MPLTTLRLHGHGRVEVELIVNFLEDLRYAYASLFVFFDILPEREPGSYLAETFLFLRRFAPEPDRLMDRQMGVKELELYIPSSERLIMKAVRLSSPGVWEFLGALNPLEVIRKSLNDLHERRKDREYREAAERERLELENALLESEVLSQRIKIAKELGATDRELALLMNKFVFEPLKALRRHQIDGLVDNAHIEDDPGNDDVHFG